MKYYFTLISLLISQIGFSQTIKTIILKNGNKYPGTIIKTDSSKVVFMGRDYNTYVFDTSEILGFKDHIEYKQRPALIQTKWTHEFGFGPNQTIEKFNNKLYRSYGFTLGYSIGKQFNYKHTVSADFLMIINYSIYPTLGLGYRYDLIKSANTPFVYANLGNYWEPGWSSMGFRRGAGIGYQFGLSGYKRFIIKMDMNRVQTKYYVSSNTREELKSTVINTSIGWRF